MSPNPTHHDHDDPLSFLNGVEAAWLAVNRDGSLCRHCTPTDVQMLPMGGNGWAVGWSHDRACPDHEDV